MPDFNSLTKPGLIPPLDRGYRPAVLTNHDFRRRVAEAGGGVPLVFGLERNDGAVSRFESAVLPHDHPQAADNLPYGERLLKFLLWQRGGYKVYVGGPVDVGNYIKQCYAPDGARAFDCHFMGEDVYERLFTVVPCAPDDVPPENERTYSLGRHLDGCRIGFDLGASDLKVSAVVEGEAIFSQEIAWEPRRVGQSNAAASLPIIRR